ncbi:MAG: M20 family peptidase [Parvibaculum sp.]|nr:M20 family peptidase [Parvibaculum sp.]
MKRLVAGILAIVLVLIAVVIGRTLMLPPPPVVDASALPAPISNDAAMRAAANLSAAIKMPTISWQRGATGDKAEASQKALVDFRDFISATYPAFTAATTREIVSDYSLLFTWRGSDESLKPVLLMSHMDVVPVVAGTEGDWIHAPFAGEIADGSVWGRGAIDCKGSLIAMLEAAETLSAQSFQPKRTIMFAFGHDEEVSGLNGNLKIAQMLEARGVKLAFVSDEGGMVTQGVVGGVTGPVAIIGIAEKGYMTLQLTAHAKGGHSSMPPAQNETAVGRLIKAMTHVGAAPFKSGMDVPTRAMLDALAPAMPFTRRMVFANMWLFEPLVVSLMSAEPSTGAQLHTTIAPTMLKAGVKENVLPPEAEGIINFRLHRRDTIESAIAHVTAAIDDPEVDIATLEGAREASAVSNLEGASFALLRQSISASFPDALIAPNLTVAGTDSRHYLPLTDNVFRFVPLRLNAAELAGFHATNERVPVASLGEAVGFYVSMMQNLDAPEL